MTKEKFRELCEQVMVPMVSKLIRREAVEHEEILGALMRELLQVSDRLQALVRVLGMREDQGNLG
jgi:hypothetical protein